jgi:hypothetical protein
VSVFHRQKRSMASQSTIQLASIRVNPPQELPSL